MKLARVVKGDLTAYFDVDDTLISWERPTTPDHDSIRLKDLDGVDVIVGVNWPNIDAIAKHALRGHTVVVWSAGGAEWASRVVQALHLEEYVDVIITKPTWYYDDLPANEFMGKRVFHERL